MFVISNSKEAIDNINAYITNELGLNDEENGTTIYGEVKEHPNGELFAIYLNSVAQGVFNATGMDTSETLSSDWFESIGDGT